MGELVVGDVVVAQFPFSNLKTVKSRPAIVLGLGDYNDPILCQITSFKDQALNTVPINDTSFVFGKLPVSSYARPDKLFTADKSIITRVVGHLSNQTMLNIKSRLKKVLDL